MKIHFVGIGGIGVSALARHFVAEGFLVSGSDLFANNLIMEGVKVFQGHSSENIESDTDMVVYSPAIKDDNPEILRAKELGIKVQSYPEALGDLTRNHYTVAVSGTHGKSTTTAMLSLIMIKARLDPTVIIGTKLKEFNNSNYRKGNSKYLLIEADEFRASFLNYHTNMCVLTNIEEDHLDYYKDLNDILDAFSTYLSFVKDGAVIANKDDKNILHLLKDFDEVPVVWYQIGEKEVFSIRRSLSVPGEHNVYNALAAFHAAKEMGIDEKTILLALSEFKGSWRRFEEKEVLLTNGKKVILINDYAHHPTEVKATMSAVKEKYPQKKIVAVFQPHQYERSYRLFSSFINVLSGISSDDLFITDIYTVAGRESEEIKKKVSARMISEQSKGSTYSGNLRNTAEKLLKHLQGEEVVVIMGAGDVYKLEEMISK